MSHIRNAGAGLVLLLVSLSLRAEPFADARPVFSVYGAQLSAERSWQQVLTPGDSKFVNAYLAAGSVAAPYARLLAGALQLEAEGQLVRHFGAQDHWEVRAIPFVVRWVQFPWSAHARTSAAWGLGLSYATEVPPMEATLREESRRFLVHWFAEVTTGPAAAPWEVSLRLHHRSDGLGLLGTEGGMNALGFGVRVHFH